MKDLVTKLANSSQDNRPSVMNAIINTINSSPQDFLNFKQELINQGLEKTHIGALSYVLERLNFVPPPSSRDIVGEYVYRGSGLSPAEIKRRGGFQSAGQSRSILEHQRQTGSSIYVGASKDLMIAAEHAFQHERKFIYKIATDNGICVNEFLHPLKGQSLEQEVVFAHKIPISQVHSYVIVIDLDNIPTTFLAI